MTINITAESVSWYGAIVATLAFIASTLSLYLYYQESRPRVKVEYKKGRRMLNARPPYKPDTDYLVITVINKGKRPVTMHNVVAATRNEKTKYAILSDSLQGSRKLNDGESTDYILEESLIEFKNIKYFVAYDGIGNAYKVKVKHE